MKSDILTEFLLLYFEIFLIKIFDATLKGVYAILRFLTLSDNAWRYLTLPRKIYIINLFDTFWRYLTLYDATYKPMTPSDAL